MAWRDPVITDLLDRHLAELRKAGYVGTAPRPGPDKNNIRKLLEEAGYGPREDVVDFFSWAHYPPPNGSFDLFWETPMPLGIIDALALGDSMRRCLQEDLRYLNMSSVDELEPGLVDLLFSGPDHRLPLVQLDGAEYVSVDTSVTGGLGGSVWFSFTQSESFKMFDSLAEAIEAATYCIQSGLWRVEDDGYRIACDRDSMPDAQDLANPPW